MRDFELRRYTLDWMGRSDQFRSASRGTFWPSEASVQFTDNQGETKTVGKCLRATYYRLAGYAPTNPPTAKSRVTFLLGHSVEESVIETWKQAGIWDNNSVRFEDTSINLSGEFDAILKIPGQPERKFGVEVKSFYGYFQEKKLLGGFEGRGNNRRRVYGYPKDENLLQAALYADQTRGVLEGFKIFYVSRGNCDMAEFNVTVDDEGTIFVQNPERQDQTIENRFNIHDIYARFRQLKEYRDQNQLPPRDYTWKPSDEVVEQLYQQNEISNNQYKKHTEGKERYTDWHCNYCDFRDQCWTRQGNPRD